MSGSPSSKKKLRFNVSLYTCLQFLSASVFEKTRISCALQQAISHTLLHYHGNQLILFDIKPDTTALRYVFSIP